MFGYYETNGKKIKRELFGKITERISTLVENSQFKKPIKKLKKHLHFMKIYTKLESANNKQKR